MGLIEWFRRPSRPSITVWLDDESELRGFVAGVKVDAGRGHTVLVVAHFKEKLIQVGQALAEAGIQFELRTAWTAQDTEALRSGSPKVIAMLAAALPDVPEHGPRAAAPPDAPIVSLRVADMHVLDDENKRVERFAAHLPKGTRMTLSLSFDSPIMTTFAKPWVKTMMLRLGLTADQPIKSPMVDNGLRRAVRKLERKAIGNASFDSLHEWMQRNLPE